VTRLCDRSPQHWAAVLQRLTGVLLALFLPLHFWVLGLALHDEAGLDSFLKWSEAPLVKLAEAGLVLLLTLHLVGGLRILMIEFLAWREWQGRLVAVAGGAALAMGLLFLLRAV
jgi:succinate dehydrogenase subunit D